MQFLKKHITELCFMLLLCGTLWGAVQLIVSGHIFNGDFALYIRQACELARFKLDGVGAAFRLVRECFEPFGGLRLFSAESRAQKRQV